MLKVAGVVVLYNPTEEIYNNVLSYVNQVDYLYVVDNSEMTSENANIVIAAHPDRVKLIKKKQNIGIAASLNLAAEIAVKDGSDLLLTMDQDSRVSENYIPKMLQVFERDNEIGILAPFIIHTKNPRTPKDSGIENITVAMTSGSLIRLSAHREIGGFLEKLFIDYVDNEYCLRMKSFGFKVMKLNSVYVYHELGEVKFRKFLFKDVFPTNHSALRLYYRSRNRFYIHKVYKNIFPKYIKFDRYVFIKEIFKVFLYEKNKTEKIKMIFLGYVDYRKNKFGKFE